MSCCELFNRQSSQAMEGLEIVLSLSGWGFFNGKGSDGKCVNMNYLLVNIIP